MKKFKVWFVIKYIILVILICYGNDKTYAQTKPDLSKIKTNIDQLEAWRNYCNKLLVDLKFTKTLIKESKYGLKLCKANDYRYQGIFMLFAGCAYENQKQYDSAAYYLEKSAIMSGKAKRSRNVMVALSRLDYIYGYTNNTVKRKSTLAWMKKIADTTSNLSIKQLAVVALGGYYSDMEDYETSIKYRLQNIELYKKLLKTDTLVGSPIDIGYFLTNIGGLYLQMGRYQKAIEYLDEAKTYIGNTVMRNGEQTLYSSYIKSYLGLNKVDSAKAYYHRIYKGMAGIDSIYNLLSYANQHFGNYYLEKNKIDSALIYAKKATLLAKKAPEADPLINANVLNGKLLYQQRKYAEVIVLLLPALNGSYEFNKSGLAELHNILSKSYAALKQWDKAYKHGEKYNELSSLIQTAQANKNFNEIEGKYQNSQKIKQIKLKNLELSDAKKQRIWLFSGLLLLLFVAGLLFVIYRNKKKTADILDKKNQQLDLLNEQLKGANETKAKLFSIISHDLRSPVSQLFAFLKLQQTNPNYISEEEKNKHQKRLMESSVSLLTTMEDLLLWSKSQMEQFELDIETIDIEELFNEVILLMQNQAEVNGIVIKIGNLTLTNLQSDQNLMTIVLRNLLQNAINHAHGNSTIYLNAAVNEIGKSYISILNQGEVIPEVKINALIHDNNVNSKSSGYGLMIVKELLLKLNAVLQIESNANTTSMIVVFSA